jgi:hypothetical protein
VSLSVIFLLDFGTVPTVWYILFFTLLGKRFENSVRVYLILIENLVKSLRIIIRSVCE